MTSSTSKTARALNNPMRFGLLIHEVSRLRRVAVNRALKPLGITRSQGYVLAFLLRRDGMSQTALADDLDLTRVAISGLLGRMELLGLVQRKDDEFDARVRRVYLARPGYQLARKIIKLVDAFDQELLADMESELEATLPALMQIKRRLLRTIGEPGRQDEPAEIAEDEEA